MIFRSNPCILVLLRHDMQRGVAKHFGITLAIRVTQLSHEPLSIDRFEKLDLIIWLRPEFTLAMFILRWPKNPFHCTLQNRMHGFNRLSAL